MNWDANICTMAHSEIVLNIQFTYPLFLDLIGMVEFHSAPEEVLLTDHLRHYDRRTVAIPFCSPIIRRKRKIEKRNINWLLTELWGMHFVKFVFFVVLMIFCRIPILCLQFYYYKVFIVQCKCVDVLTCVPFLLEPYSRQMPSVSGSCHQHQN